MVLPDQEDEFTQHGQNAYYLRRQDRQRPIGRLPGENRKQHRERIKREKRNSRPPKTSSGSLRAKQ